ncbi:hypothetical protein SAMN04487939_102186 [Lysobacter sp. yr284]|uniref:hypothetical protein n=1 Tax=Lysobacter sp. yr284 TaxID=1761791 RepID=UPI00089B8940|nr:hypothetical protein [Lysobacter sp. yr284]SDY44791.1 hypothetical protein SAMN04487939_102186 [Lysobacter sp. yr284]
MTGDAVGGTPARMPELSALRGQAVRAFECARTGVLWLVLGICIAFLAPKADSRLLTYIAGAVVFLATLVHCRAAALETRFALGARRYLSEHWNASPLPGLAELLRLGRRRLRTAIVAWMLAAMVALLVVPIGLTFEVPVALRVHAVVLVLSAARLQHMATVDRRLLREIGEHVRSLARRDIVAA